MTGQRRPPARKRDAAATRAAILSAAKVRFAREGFDAASLRNVAADVAVDHALVSRYFGSKAKLFAAVLAHSIEPNLLTPGTPEAVSRQIVDLLTDPSRREGLDGVMVVARALSSPVVSDAERDNILASFIAPVQTALAGRIDKTQAHLVVAAIVGAAITRDLWSALAEPERSAYRDRLIRVFMQALEPQG